MKDFRKHNDKELIATVAGSGEPDKSAAFSEIYNRYSRKIFLYCRKVADSESAADDLFQDTFMQLLKSIENEVIITNVKGYLLKIARNLALNMKRVKNPETVSFEDVKYLFNDNAFESRDLAELVDSALELLPEEHKEAFILQAYYGLTYSEIADVTEVPLSTVRNRVVRAKSKLREILTPILEERN